jgi:hypothetical protein
MAPQVVSCARAEIGSIEGRSRQLSAFRFRQAEDISRKAAKAQGYTGAEAQRDRIRKPFSADGLIADCVFTKHSDGSAGRIQ